MKKGLNGIEIAYLLVWGLLLAVMTVWGAKYKAPDNTIPMNWGMIISALLIGHFAISFKVVKPGEIGAIIRLGTPIKNAGPGPHLTPFPIYQMQKESALLFQDQFPADPENIFEGDDDQPLPPGKFRPIRVTHIGNEDSKDPLERSMTTSLLMVESFRITDYVKFLIIVGTVENAKRMIRDMMSRTAESELAQKTVRKSLTEKEAISGVIKMATTGMITDWGVDLHDAYLERIIISKNVSKTLKDVPVSELAAQSTVITATADRKAKILGAQASAKKIELEGEANAEVLKKTGLSKAAAEKMLLEAQARGYKKIAEELGVTEGQVVLAMETMRNTLANSQFSYISGSGGMADLLNFLPAVQQALAKIKPAPTTPTP